MKQVKKAAKKPLPAKGMKVDKIFVFLTQDANGNEGIAGFPHKERGYVPLITADKDRADRLKEAAQEIALGSGKEVRLVQYKVRRDLEVFGAAKAKA
jgi:hypothetical protein